MDLILNTFGVSLSKDNEAFVIAHKDGKNRVPPQGIKSIQMSSGAQITSDAVLLAIEHEIEILFLNKSGEPMGRIWSNRYGSISLIRKGQLNFSFSKEAIDWIKNTLATKMENQQALMLAMRTKETHIQRIVERAIQRIDDYKNKLKALDAEVISDIAPTIRGWEGQASKIYFETLNLFIPEEIRFSKRSQHPATDIVNALLNYGYGILYGKVEGALIKSGIDPYIGVFHRDDYNRPVLVYDVIEIYRVWVDYVVFTLVQQNCITDEFYSIKKDGSYWLEGLGRRIIIQSLNDYLDEVILMNGISRSRETHILLNAQKLAQKFKDFM
ncbi:MAG: CRISPR-associated endonuclease Cas1 [Bacteroides pyogenes]|jgi:CRISPR-associated protein Cas1|uniref:CRISPR-associated endonuclease Cas1 n=1 Tax=Bacteroides pyogenes TaxID=310300 RepID=UPI002431CF3E|nr:CRISPR-associated endonuclease Cas1 [Bacteroides pyogenes]MCI7069911.1 CRISPR-associated endonuclease Cas1 [Bacteroides pyogenes]